MPTYSKLIHAPTWDQTPLIGYLNLLYFGARVTYLFTALKDIEGHNTGMGKTARQDTTEATEGVEFGRVKLDLLGVRHK